MSTEAAHIRCRRAQCNNFEGDKPFSKCGRCRIAKYCSRECQVQDWPLHKLMCNPDRVILNQDGTTERVADMLARKDGGNVETSSESAPNAVPKYVSIMDMSHEDVCRSTIERLQLQTNPFVIDQWKKAGQKGFLFVQTESTLDDFRYLAGIKNGERLDRGFVCYYMSYREFTKDVITEHPNANLRKGAFLSELKKLVEGYNPEEEMVTVGVFGCGYTHVMKSELPPLKTIMDLLKQDPNMFQDQDCIELYIDR